MSLRPGMVMTEMTEETWLTDARLPRPAIESTIAMGRVGQAEEIANADPLAAVGRGLASSPA